MTLKVLIDVQSCQSSSKMRGIGRYSFDLVNSIIKNSEGLVDIHLLLNASFQTEVIELRSFFEKKLGKSNIHVFSCDLHNPVVEGDVYLDGSAELIREEFIKSINPDFFLITSFFEGIGDLSITSAPRIPGKVGVILYDLIPLLSPSDYLKNKYVKGWYLSKIESLKKDFDIIFSISEASRIEAIDNLFIDASKIINISSAASRIFLDKAYICVDSKKIPENSEYFLYTANLDSRKNLSGMFESFGIFKNKFHSNIKLVIVSYVDDMARSRIYSLAKKYDVKANDLVLTGYISDEELINLYRNCKLFVFPSLHEGFGLPCLEAMSCGAAVIGSNITSIPEVINFDEALFDPRNANEIAECMYKAIVDKSFHRQLVENSERQAKSFSWDKTSKKLLDVVSNLKTDNIPAVNNVIDDGVFYEKIRLLSVGFSKRDYIRCAKAIELLNSNNVPSIFIDVTAIAEFDANTGIQRVVRSIVRNLPPYIVNRVKLVRLVQAGWYEYAYEYQKIELGAAEDRGVVVPLKGDIFLGLDLIADKAKEVEKLYMEWRARGVQISFVIYDILPVLHPEFFHQGMSRVFPEWLNMVMECGDQLICISNAVATELFEYKKNACLSLKRKLEQKISYFHLGADFDVKEKVNQKYFKGLELSKTFLMVGTIEPRKGHAHAIGAFEELIKERPDYNLVIVGKVGWNSDELMNKLEKYNRESDNIRWFQESSDAELALLYQNTCALIAGSYGEGFGLPLIEAAFYKLPIIARDIVVFREVAQNGAFYFDANCSDSQLKDCYLEWIRLYENNQHPRSELVKFLSWGESTEHLLSIIDESPKLRDEIV